MAGLLDYCGFADSISGGPTGNLGRGRRLRGSKPAMVTRTAPYCLWSVAMTAFNIVKFKVKSGQEKAFLDAHAGDKARVDADVRETCNEPAITKIWRWLRQRSRAVFEAASRSGERM